MLDRTDWSAAKKHPFIIPSYREMFEERLVQPESNTRDTWNDFEHYKVLASFPTSNLKCYTSRYGVAPRGHTFTYPDCGVQWNPAIWGALDNPISGLPVLYEKNAITGEFVKLVSNVDTLINQSVRTMLGTVRPKTSFLNSVVELKDFSSLPRSAERALKGLGEAAKLFPTLLDTAERVYPKGKRTLFRILGAVSDAFLQKEFNISPLLDDINSIVEVTETFRRKINKLIADEGIPRRRDFNTPLSKDFIDSSETVKTAYNNALVLNNYKPDGLDLYLRQYRTVKYTHAQFHAQIEYTKYYQGYQRENALLLGFLDRIGVMFDPSILWNAIPWSFAADWIIDVSQYLKQFRYQNLEPVTVVHKFCWSQRVRRVITGTVCTNIDYPRISSGNRTACLITEDAYKRSTQRLNVIGALSGSGISLKEFVLGSALAFSRKS